MFPLLYKYCKFSENDYDFINLQNDTLFFHSPTEYNDPYEGVIDTPILDFFEAKLIAEYVCKPNKKIDIKEIKEVIDTFKIIELLGKTEPDNLIYLKEKLLSTLSKALISKKREEYNIFLYLYSNEKYLKSFQKISEANMDVTEYQKFVKDIINENNDIDNDAKEFYIDFLTQNYKSKYEIINSYRQECTVIVPIYIVDSIYGTPYKKGTYLETLKNYNEMAIETFEIVRKMPEKFFLTTCLTENYKSTSMWTHYANNNEGFCVEYDFNRSNDELIIERLQKVQYTDVMPKLPLESLVQLFLIKLDPTYIKNPEVSQKTARVIISAILTKNKSWEYETEWRIILSKLNGEHIHKFPYVSKIILGVSILPENKDKLIRLSTKKIYHYIKRIFCLINVKLQFILTDRFIFDFIKAFDLFERLCFIFYLSGIVARY